MKSETFIEHFLETYAFFWPTRVQEHNGALNIGEKYTPMIRGLDSIAPYFKRFPEELILKGFKKVKAEEKTPHNIAGWVLRYCRENYRPPVEDDFFNPEALEKCDICDGSGIVDRITDFQIYSLACSCEMAKNFEPYFTEFPVKHQFTWNKDLFPTYQYCYLSYYALLVKTGYWMQSEESDPWQFLLSIHNGYSAAMEAAALQIYEATKSERPKFDEKENQIVKKMPEAFKTRKEGKYVSPF